MGYIGVITHIYNPLILTFNPNFQPDHSNQEVMGTDCFLPFGFCGLCLKAPKDFDMFVCELKKTYKVGPYQL